VKGFTLIELLIVMVLIGLITGMAMLSMGTTDPRDRQKLEAERLVKLLELASQEAVVSGDILGLEIFSKGYRFAVVENQKWRQESSDMVFRPRTLMPQMLLALDIEQQVVTLIPEANQVSDPDPQIIFTPDGDMALFNIKMTLKNNDSIFVVKNTLKDGLVIRAENRL
jgi:general secretion pathway protein H